MQHRFRSEGDLHGHAVGNLLIVALWELLGDPVAGLDWVGRLLGAHGRVLPMASVPLDIEAVMALDRPTVPTPDRSSGRCVRGQVAVAHDARPRGRPSPWCRTGPAGLPGGRGGRARGRLGRARARVLVHQRAPAPAGARRWPRPLYATRARRLVDAQPGAAAGRDRRLLPGDAPGGAPAARARTCRLDVVLADPAVVPRPRRARRRSQRRSARGLVIADVAAADGQPEHARPRPSRRRPGEIFRQKR